MARISSEVSRGLDEYLVTSGHQSAGATPSRVRLKGYVRGLEMPLSWFSAAMQCVSGDELGIALAQYGGCSVLPRSLSVEDQVGMGRRIKKAKAGFNYAVTTVQPDMLIGDLMELQQETGHSSYPVVDESGTLVGLITEKKYHPGKDASAKVADRMIGREDVVVGDEGISLGDANEMLLSRGLGTLPIVDGEGKYVASVFWADMDKHVRHPDEFVDDNGRYRFAAAVSTFQEDIERAEALMGAGCDILVVDTSDLKSDYGVLTVRKLRQQFPDAPIMAGNIIDEEGFIAIADAGADVVKVGQGPGYGCSTREVKRSGRGQATAIMQVAAARDAYNIRNGSDVRICADGGMSNSGHMILATAMGADFLMMGQYFGEFTESAAPVKRVFTEVMIGGKRMIVPVIVKEYWGEASRRAQNIQRYGYSSIETFVPEGEETVILHRGSIHGPDGLALDVAFVKKTISESGAHNPREFSERATLELQSEGSRAEGRPKV